MAWRRGGGVVDPAGVHDRNGDLPPDLTGELQVRCDRGSHGRDHPGKRLVAGHVPADDADEVHALTDDLARNLQCLFAAQSPRCLFVERHPDADDEVRARGLAHRADHPQGEPQPVLEAAAELIVAVIGQGRPECVEQMGVGLQFDTVQAGLAATRRGVGVVPHDPVHVPRLGGLRKGSVRRFADGGWCEHRQPVAVVIACAAAQVGDLAHHRGTMFVHVVGQLAKPRHDLVLVHVQVAERGRALRRHHRGAAHHRQSDPALGLLDVVEAVPVLGHPVLGVRRLVRSADDTIA